MRKAEPLLESPFERDVLERLVRAGYRVTPQWEVGHYRIDLVVEGGGRKLAVECDGDRYHPLEKLPEDMARQAILERLGWRFARIRGSAFFRDPDGAMAPVFARLKELRVAPDGAASKPPAQQTSALQADLVRRAAEIGRSWFEASESSSPGDAVEPRLHSGFVPGRSGSARSQQPSTSTRGNSATPTVTQSGQPPAVDHDGVWGATPAHPETATAARIGVASAVPRTFQLLIGRSKEAVRDAIVRVLGPAAHSCAVCGSRRRVWIGNDGPFIQCDRRECAKREVVSVPVLTAALSEIGASCDCGARLRIARGIGNATFIGCSDYPKHRKSLAWKDL